MFNAFKIAANAFRETLREPVYILMLLAALILIGHYPTAAIFAFSEQIKLVVDSSLATTLLFGIFISVLAAAYSVTREMQHGTVLLLLSKPVGRASFILGKLAGIMAAGVLFTLLCHLAAIVSVYVATDQFRFQIGLYIAFLVLLAVACIIGLLWNFFSGSNFSEVTVWAIVVLLSGFTLYCIIQCPHPACNMINLVKAMILVTLSVGAMTTIATVLAAVLDVVPNLVVSTMIFVLGLMSSYLFQRQTGLWFVDVVLDALYAVVPNWQFFWLADALALNRTIPWTYVLSAALYMVLYVALAGCWAVAIFRTREPAENTR